MKFAALALDYDGTIATNGVFNPGVRTAIGEVRQRRVAVVNQGALRKLCAVPSPTAIPAGTFHDLATNEAALLPGAEEAHGAIRRFQLAPRLTAHVRHQTKYLDMPVAEAQAFVFSADGRTLRNRR